MTARPRETAASAIERLALIKVLLDNLPPVGVEWPIADRARWLQATVAVMAYLYGGSVDDIEISFTETT